MSAGDRIFFSDFRQGIIAQARRTTPSSATVTAEVAYLRMDSISLLAGRAYKIWTSPLTLKGSVSGDVVQAKVRINTTTTCTVANGTEITHVRDDTLNSANCPRIPLTGLYLPGVNQTVSVLLTIGRSVAGAGSTGCQLFASGVETCDFLVQDVGVAVTDTGVSL